MQSNGNQNASFQLKTQHKTKQLWKQKISKMAVLLSYQSNKRKLRTKKKSFTYNLIQINIKIKIYS